LKQINFITGGPLAEGGPGQLPPLPPPSSGPASVLSEVNALGIKDYNGRMYFFPRHMVFPGGSVMPGSRRPNVWSIDSKCKTKN